MIEENFLYHFKKKYPKLSYRSISEQSGIQLSRVYRIFNGFPMKVVELEALTKILIESEVPSSLPHSFFEFLSYGNQSDRLELGRFFSRLKRKRSLRLVARFQSGGHV